MPDQATDYLDPRQMGPIPQAVDQPGGPVIALQPPSQISQADIDKLVQRRVSITSDTVGRLRDLDAQRMKLASEPTPRPALPKYQDIPQPPQEQARSVFKEAAPALIFLTAMGAAMTRQHGMGAMAAATGFMQGFDQGDKDRMALERQKWQDSVSAIERQNQIETEKYNAVLHNDQLSQQDKQAKLTALAASFDDQVMINSLQTGDVQFQAGLIEHRAQMASKLSNPAAFALNQFIEENRARGHEPTAQEIQSFIQQGRSAGRSGLMVYVNKYIEEQRQKGHEPTADEIKTATQQYQTQTTAQNRFLSGPQGNVVRSLNVVVGHLSTMQELGGALQNGDFPAFNRLAQRLAEETGKSAPTNFDTAKQIVGTEIIKAIGVAGAGTSDERKNASDMFNRARSPEQLNGAIAYARKLLTAQLDALRRQWTASTGLPVEQFDQMLEPETLKFFNQQDKPNAGTTSSGIQWKVNP